MPGLFGNVEVIATAHVPLLDQIDAAGEPPVEQTAAIEHALRVAGVVVDGLRNASADADVEPMLPLYKEYGCGVLARIAAFDAQMQTDGELKQFVDAQNATLVAVSFRTPATDSCSRAFFLFFLSALCSVQ